MLFSLKKYSVRASLRSNYSTHYINTIVSARTKLGATIKARAYFNSKYYYEIKRGHILIMNKAPQLLKEAK